MKFEFVVTAGEGTLIRFGVADCPNDVAIETLHAAYSGHSIQAEPCDDQCETGE